MIYFIRCATTGLVKIGKTATADLLVERLITLRVGSPTRLVLESVLDGYTAEEAALHHLHLASWSHGEWFGKVEIPASAHDVSLFIREEATDRKRRSIERQIAGVSVLAYEMRRRSGLSHELALRGSPKLRARPSVGPVPLPTDAGGLVYFIRCETTGLTKIGSVGQQRSVATRLRSFQTSSATRLRLAAVIDGGRAREVALHREYVDRLVHGEWFRDVAAPPSAYDLALFPSACCVEPPVVAYRAPGPCAHCGRLFKKRNRAQTLCSIACRTDATGRRKRCSCGAIVTRKNYVECRACWASKRGKKLRLAERIAPDVGLTVGAVYNILAGHVPGLRRGGLAVRAHPLAAGVFG